MKYKIIKLLLISTYCLSLFGCELNIVEINDKTQHAFFNEINNNYSKDYLDQFEEVTVDRVIDGDTFVT